MATIAVRRPTRRPAPELPAGDLVVPAPPDPPRATGSRWPLLLTMIPMLTGTVASAMMFAGREGGSYAYVIGGVFGISSLGMLATGFGGGGFGRGRAETLAARQDYLHQLAALRAIVRRTATQQRTGLAYRHPDPDRLWSIVDSYRLWERRPDDEDFGVVRTGRGSQDLATALIPPDTPPRDNLEPTSANALRAFLRTYAVLPDLPVAISLPGFSRVHLRGPAPAVRDLARALIAQLTVFHAPGELTIAACVGPDRLAAWDYLKWLPHTAHPTETDAAGPLRLVGGRASDLEKGLSGPRVVLLVDGGDMNIWGYGESQPHHITVIDLDTPPPRLPDPATITLTVSADGRLRSATPDGERDVGAADTLGLPSAAALARQLAPLRVAASGPAQAPGGTGGLANLLGVTDPARWTPARGWRARDERSRLRVPIGSTDDGAVVELDLKEAAQDGMGPHGLLIGATGSGKSELLRTIVLGLASRHDSAALNFVLIDFKGGATFSSLDRLPHTAAVITNLAGELPLVDRMTDALNGELVRRQELLRRAGNFASLRDYEASGGGAPMPVLLVICDEFSELLVAKPEFIDLFLQIGRVGRSLGVHLLLASQRLEEGRLRGLDHHLSYRLSLRTFSAMESRSVLGSPDAYELPRSPGHGFLKHGTEPPTRFRAAYVSGPHRTGSTSTAGPPAGVLPFRAGRVGAPASPPIVPSTDLPSVLDVMVERLVGSGTPAHQVWLPPLSDPAGLADLLGTLVTEPDAGLTTPDARLRGTLRVPVGLVDRPFEQRRDTHWIALSGPAGHLAVVGAPQSGKSTVLRTVLCGLSLTHTPQEVTLYCLDFGGGGLAGLRDLPHVGGVAGRLDQAAVRRTVGEVAAVLARRESGEDASQGHTFLVVDGWPTLRAEYDDLEPVITDLATRGLSYRVHVIVTAPRWVDFRSGLRDLFGSRLELRLGDPADSVVSRKAAANVPSRSPGRGLTPDGLHLLTAVPVVTAGPEIDPAGEAGLVRAIAEAWTGPHAPRVRLLPTELSYPVAWNGDGIAIGISEADLGPVALDFTAEPHLLVFGDAESGKTAFLRALARSICDRYTPDEARIVLLDYRRGLLGAVGPEHLLGYGSGSAQAGELVTAVAESMRQRLPGADITPQQLRDRSWWRGPECFVLADDYDLIATGTGNPLLALLDYLPQARDIGLRLVLTRRSGGAARALYEPVIQRLRELSPAGLVLSGERDEGVLLGTVRPSPQPPGRGFLMTRREGPRLVQLAYLPS